MTDADRPAWLSRHLDDLPAEIEPARDLWPDIERRLGRPARHGFRPGFAVAMAASLLLSVGLALFAWQALRHAEAERAATAAMVAELLAPYREIEAEQALRWQAVRAGLEPGIAASLQHDVDQLASARDTLSGALAAAPTDPVLHQLMRQVIVRHSELTEAGAHLGGMTL
jgi:hypothetical protein